MSRAAPSLFAVVTRRIVFFAVIAMLAQLAGVFHRYWSDEEELGRLAIENETSALAHGVVHEGGVVRFALPHDLEERYGHSDHGYFARVRTANGTVLFSNCDTECREHFLPVSLAPPSFWMKELKPGRPLNIAGGAIVDRHDEPILIEVAIIGDREGVLTEVFAREVADHMVLPMSLMLVVVLGATMLSIVQALRPVRHAAGLAASLDPLAPDSRLPTEGMPGEIAKFTRAVNAAFDRVGELVRAQKVFTAAISHEVRTPLAVARLELEKIADPRARKVEQDLEDLNRLVEELTTLARLEGADLAPTEPIEPAALAESVVSALAPLAFASGKTIGLADRGGTVFSGYPALAENALRNLVENAIRHGVPGAAITVEVGPGPQFSVRDDGKGRKAGAPPADGAAQGLGLKIVGRIAEIHGGTFTFALPPTGGSTARIRFGKG